MMTLDRLGIATLIMVTVLSVIFLFIGVFPFSKRVTKDNRIPHELIEWTDSTGCKACIWIDGAAYYGDGIDNMAGETPRFIVHRGDDYLVLPDKIIVRETE
jgi:hypothetical protein